jgi:hypothetical protein
MKQGIIKVLILYSSGLLISVLTYYFLGEGHQHGPGLYIVIPFLTLVIGGIWTVRTFIDYFFKNQTDERKGIMYANGLVIGLFLAYIFYLRSSNKFESGDSYEQSNSQLSVGQSGDTATIDYNGKTIYLKIKDSVYFDKRDSLTKTFR